MITPSPFLAKPERWLLEGEYAFVFDNEYPVLRGHTLVVPKREVESMFDINEKEWLEIKGLTENYICSVKAVGFNFALNAGAVAGQSVAHVHFHIFPHFEPHHAMLKGGYANAFGHLPSYCR